MKTVIMLKLLNFQEVIAHTDTTNVDDIFSMKFDNLRLYDVLTIVGMSKQEHNGEEYAIPEFQPLNPFGESLEDSIVLNKDGILYVHPGNPGIREYYQHVLSGLKGTIIKAPEKGIIMPH